MEKNSDPHVQRHGSHDAAPVGFMCNGSDLTVTVRYTGSVEGFIASRVLQVVLVPKKVQIEARTPLRPRTVWSPEVCSSFNGETV